jgi:enamine deaminase RidA (YjgF/YER057c/UK114 family)
MSIRHVNPPTLFRNPEFAQIVIGDAKRLAFIAGQGAFDPDFNLIGEGDLHAQTVQAFRNLTHALTAAGVTPGDVLMSTIYVVDLDEEKTGIFVDAMRVALDGQCFPPNASTLVGVTRLGDPRMLVEISAIASVA